MKKSLLLLVFFSSTFLVSAQSADQEVKAVIQTLFDGMRAKNIEMISSAFDPDAMMQTVVSNPEGSETRGNSVSDFLDRIGQTPADTQLDERILDYQIKVDGTLASAWTPYEFYVNETFSHCGVNSFQLVKKSEGWKIVFIIDTRRKEGCK
ncbi:nuclear transport factor 2 family protein [Algoriphagus namhaensis]|uniref:Nuclear transport factor 2 family protein n=1 Tax=Algoriphagus namhaensis TaxID=915353 RepID=A0ABV8AMA7_9BACT